MNKFASWLKAERGRAAELSRYIGYSQSFISNVRAGRKQFPPRVLKHVIEFSNGGLSYDELIPDAPLGQKRRC